MFRTAVSVVAAAMLAFVTPAAADVTIRFEPGPLDGAKIVTPWGTYIAVAEGNEVWVGTEKEYTDRLVRAISRDEGFREFCALGQQHCNTFVEADLPRVFTGHDELGSITVNAMFESDPEAHRPRLKPGQEYVEVIWVQRGHEPTRAVISDRSTGAAYTGRCGVDSDFHHCDFVVPRASLTHPAMVAFLSPHQAPGVLPGKSIAWLAYNTLAEHVHSSEKAGGRIDPNDPEDDTYRNLARLHALDGEIPGAP